MSWASRTTPSSLAQQDKRGSGGQARPAADRAQHGRRLQRVHQRAGTEPAVAAGRGRAGASRQPVRANSRCWPPLPPRRAHPWSACRRPRSVRPGTSPSTECSPDCLAWSSACCSPRCARCYGRPWPSRAPVPGNLVRCCSAPPKNAAARSSRLARTCPSASTWPPTVPGSARGAHRAWVARRLSSLAARLRGELPSPELADARALAAGRIETDPGGNASPNGDACARRCRQRAPHGRPGHR